MPSKSIYIAGPMSGYPEFNFPAFNAVEDQLKSEGYTVYNPARKEDEAHLDREAVKTGDAALAISKGFNFREVYMWDLDKVVNGDGIFMLKGWEQSPGARGEHAAAVVMQKHYPEYEIRYQ